MSRYKGVVSLHNLNLVNGVELCFSAVLNELTVSRARMCTGSWFQALGPPTANAQGLWLRSSPLNDFRVRLRVRRVWW